MNLQARRLILRAEIMALLHDVGKASPEFIVGATKEKGDLGAAHTTAFLGKTGALQELLSAPLPDDWLAGIPGPRLLTLGALLAGHHGEVNENHFLMDRVLYPYLIYLIVYADTADSLFAKGTSSDLKNRFTQSEGHVHLATPFGGVEAELDMDRLPETCEALHNSLAASLRGYEKWSDEELQARRRILLEVLEDQGSKFLAETRLPNNDVSLWQHSYSVASIFKALLAGYLARDDWSGLHHENNLRHADQRLSFLAVRWDETSYMARVMRSFEIMGRRKRLDDLAEALKHLVEEDSCLGNEIYRDRSGICFLVPAIQGQTVEEEITSLIQKTEGLFNGEIIEGELPWRMTILDSGLRLGRFSALWKDEGCREIAHGPRQPVWMSRWGTGEKQQICPRCGLRPRQWDDSRTGSSADKSCRQCTDISREGYQLMSQGGVSRAASRRLFGLESLPVQRGGPGQGSNSFLQLAEDLPEDSGKEGTEGQGKRWALIQGILNLNAFASGEAFSSLLAAMPEDYKDEQLADWDSMLEATKDAWERLASRDDSKAAIGELRKILRNSRLGGQKDGWSQGESDAKRVRFYIERMILDESEMYPKSIEKEAAARIVTWGVRQHPAPSRLARVWSSAGGFTAWPMQHCYGSSIPFIPLTRDNVSFQLLVRAADAWQVLQAVLQQYEERFSGVRHVLPLHLSASVFNCKSPLYVAMDAARRFATLARDNTPRPWLLEVNSQEDGVRTLRWRDNAGRPVAWRLNCRLPDGREDLFRGWFWTEGGRHPMHLKALRPGEHYLVCPSTFDYEVLDATVRRYDIRYTQGKGRPNHALAGPGPRPYPLETLAAWKTPLGTEAFQEAKTRQRKLLQEQLCGLWHDWRSWDGAEARRSRMALDLLGLTLPQDRETLGPLVQDGSFLDLCEWNDFICK